MSRLKVKSLEGQFQHHSGVIVVERSDATDPRFSRGSAYLLIVSPKHSRPLETGSNEILNPDWRRAPCGSSH